MATSSIQLGSKRRLPALEPDVNQMIVTFEDVSVMQQVKKAIALMRGVQSVTMPRRKRMCGLDRALKDVEEGHVTRWDSVEEMFESLDKED